ncbi:MAG TPA: BamA/TamA family outer membrane protein [Oculatellaceae cyanobacterium]|jgi:outer membrane protein insertion porin family
MRFPVVAIYTLVALTTCGLPLQAFAQPNTNQKPASDYVVPVDETTAPVNAISNSPSVVVPAAATPTSSSTLVQAQTPAQLTPPPVNVPSTSTKPSTQKDVQVTATDVQVVGAANELQQFIKNTITTKSGSATSKSQIDRDVAALLATGSFTDVRATTQTTPAGIKVVYQVQPIVVRSLQLSGAKVLTPAVANDLFKSQLGATINPALIRQSIEQLQQWYAKNGYVLAQVATVRPSNQGVILIEVAEGVVGDVNFRFLDKDSKPIAGRTKTDFLTSKLQVKPGEVFQVNVARTDLQSLYKLGLFEKVDIALTGDATKANVTYDLTEVPARSINAGGGYNSDNGLVGTISYKDRNFSGINQQLGVSIQAGSRDLQFDTSFSNPFNPSDPNKLGYTINAFRRRGFSQTFDEDIKLPNGDSVRQGQFGGGITFSKPIDQWQTSLGLNYTRTSIRDRSGEISPVDSKGNQLTFSNTGIDDLVTLSAGVVRDQRNNPVSPTQGSVFSLTTEQSIPVGSGNILMNRIEGNYSQYIPAGLINAGKDKQDVLAFNIQGGTTIGDLPPYQAFNIGGINSVRGYQNGDVASGRSFVLASAEYRFPVFSVIGGVLFADYGTDLGSSDSVPGQPGVDRGKPGNGFGYGAGMRVNSPIGLIRADFGINDQGQSKIQFGIGQRF